MKLLLDSANLEQIERFMRTTAVAGVTTNPSLMAKEAKGEYLSKVVDIVMAVGRQSDCDNPKHLSVEVITLDPKEMVKQAVELYEEKTSNIDFCIKIPCTHLDVITQLSRLDINVNATACMSSFQAKLAADAGAAIVSFFYNRISDQRDVLVEKKEYYETNPLTVIDEFRKINSAGAQIICGSIRQKNDVLNSWLHGVEYVTASPAIIEDMLKHPQTDKAIAQFQKDIDSWRS